MCKGSRRSCEEQFVLALLQNDQRIGGQFGTPIVLRRRLQLPRVFGAQWHELLGKAPTYCKPFDARLLE